ncbi:hypothetical protein DV515_00001951 [Chloebia gouldiae]|uniref:Uncharacterized protein n=1 Tax=Chloebia gouldiae TaxID=44316 RepID=A0A3L8SW03_CHLGU|nr:hypothetical protein DV515_00001951 [Chloebia gouldiae]
MSSHTLRIWRVSECNNYKQSRLRAICSISAKMEVLEILITSAKFHRVTLFYTSGVRIKRNDTDPRFMSVASRYNSTVHERPNCHQVILSACHYDFLLQYHFFNDVQPKLGRSWKRGFGTTIITTGISVSSKF